MDYSSKDLHTLGESIKLSTDIFCICQHLCRHNDDNSTAETDYPKEISITSKKIVCNLWN